MEYGGDTVIISSTSEIKKIIEAYDRDVYNSSYMDIYKHTVSDDRLSADAEMLSDIYCSVSIVFPNGSTKSQDAEIRFFVDEYHPEVWKFLEESGYVG